MCIYGRILEQRDASFQHQVMSYDTRAENCIWPQFCAFSANFQWEEKCRISSFFLWLEILARFCRGRTGKWNAVQKKLKFFMNCVDILILMIII